MQNFTAFKFAPVMNYPTPDKMKVFDFTKGYDDDFIRSFAWGLGKYNEKRKNMYTASQFGGARNIHVGIDIWAKAYSPVYAFYDGEVAYTADNAQSGDYGPTLITRQQIGDQALYALCGHLSQETLKKISVGDAITKGQQIATIGDANVNGGWAPHLHFQLAVQDPGKADMPGVVAEENREEALRSYPDPRLVLGKLY